VEEVVRRFLVRGKVQGVFFRHSTRLEAERLAIRGIARNLPDGSVEVIARGTAQALQQLRVWLHRGPAQARVDAVQESDPGGFRRSLEPPRFLPSLHHQSGIRIAADAAVVACERPRPIAVLGAQVVT
jgi:acylphosphatase